MSTVVGEGSPEGLPDPVDLRIGTPERVAALAALEAHLIAKRLNPTEYGQRVEACELARDRTGLLRIFADLPAPHPDLPAATGSRAEADGGADGGDDPPPAAVAGCLTLALGLPVAVVLGFVYGSWWALAVPVVVTVVMAYVEQLRTPVRGPGAPESPPTSGSTKEE